MKTPEQESVIIENKLVLHMAWGPEDAIATHDVSRLSTASATISDPLASWLLHGAAIGLDKSRTNFMVESFMRTMRNQRWNPRSPHAAAHALHIRLMHQSDFIQVVVSVHPEREHLLHFDTFDGSRN